MASPLTLKRLASSARINSLLQSYPTSDITTHLILYELRPPMQFDSRQLDYISYWPWITDSERSGNKHVHIQLL